MSSTFLIRIVSPDSAAARALAAECRQRLQRRGQDSAISVESGGVDGLIAVHFGSGEPDLVFAAGDPTAVDRIFVLAEDRSLLPRAADTDAERMLIERLTELGYL